MVTDITRRLLTELAAALSDEGRNVVTRIDIRRGWGDAINVKIHVGVSSGYELAELKPIFKRAVDEALAQQRHGVEVVWDHRD